MRSQKHVFRSMENLKSGDPLLRWKAVRELGRIGPKAKAAVPELSEALKDHNTYVRREAARVLGWIGPGAKDAVPQLSEALNDSDAYVRKIAQEAILRIPG